ncbi:BON domain-containing protein [Segetibacter koreensis]|uniref:BON domain-containing protein n=1 Tax=Segetibacter koreensis TaxID=398037 RepID=UPI00038013A7|nr:BON domain-containing protein [Segetibacter koreensis]
MRNDADIQKDVMNELEWEPSLNASEIGVAVKDGIVTLSGRVDTYSRKLAAERAAKKIAGVKAVAQDIQVGISSDDRKTDTEIAEAVVQALKWRGFTNEDKIKVEVEDGVVTLEGEVEWKFQRETARNAIEGLIGVREIYNFIKIKPTLVPKDIKQKISAAFHRSATIDAQKVNVEVEGTTVILTGTVDSLAEKDDAEYAAWAGPGVTSVENKLKVVGKEVYEF